MFQTPQQNKRKVFFENLHPTTTEHSLRVYLSGKYQIETCKVPCKENSNNGYGIVIFSKEEYVNNLMNNRPHRIDGQQVEIYRSVPGQTSLKENKGKKNLIVSGIKDKPSRSDLAEYFDKYGLIEDITMNDGINSSRIQFNDYDSVDKALLDAPHIISRVHVKLEKGDRDYPLTTSASSNDMQCGNLNSIGAVPTQAIIRYQLSRNKLYHIHITNLPSIMNADMLSKIFHWNIYNIIMGPYSDEQSSTKCWLKGLNNQETADEFIADWDRRIDSESGIKYQIEEDTLELCKYFRVGHCFKSDDDCLWKHMQCADYTTCSSSKCLYGHTTGIYRKIIHNESNVTYRIKVTGFLTELTPQLLAQLLEYEDEKRCYVNRSQNQIGYIVNLKTTKLAKSLIEAWHGKEIEGGHKLICQLEHNIFASSSNASFKPVSERIDSYSRSASSHRSSSTTESSRDSSLSRDHNDSNNNKSDNRKINNEDTPSNQIYQPSVTQREFNAERKESTASSAYFTLQLSSDDDWETTKKLKGSKGEILLIREKINRKCLAVKKIYKDLESYKKELKVLTILKGINNVSQLIQHSPNEYNLWIITERASGYSLKEFIDSRYHNDLGVLEIIEIVQKLLIIIKQVHAQGIFYRNLRPEHIMIEWNFKKTSIKDAHLTLISFSQAYMKSEEINSADQQSKQKWYQPLQMNGEEFKYSTTIDASDICAILFWLLTNIDPEHGYDALPHQCPIAEDKINKKVTEAIRSANVTATEAELKMYLIDTFNIAFRSPVCQPWTVGNLESRLESIRELLSPTYPDLKTSEAIFRDLLSISNNPTWTTPVRITAHQDIFEKASNAFFEAKQLLLKSSENQYLWSEGNCIWLDNAQSTVNERRSDDILSYYSRQWNTSSSYPIIITGLATVSDGGNIITLSIGSSVNGKIIRIPVGRYGKNQNYLTEFANAFVVELKYLVLSIYKERKAIQ